MIISNKTLLNPNPSNVLETQQQILANSKQAVRLDVKCIRKSLCLCVLCDPYNQNLKTSPWLMIRPFFSLFTAVREYPAGIFVEQ